MKHIDAFLHVRGESEYIDDVPALKGMLYGQIFCSSIAQGKIKSFSSKIALEMEGVVEVFTAHHIPGENQIGSIIADEELLAKKDIHYVGQPIALVVAKTPEIAKKALQKIQIEFQEEGPIVTDPREAYAQLQIIGVPRTFALGNVESGFSESDHILQGKCEIGGQEHLYLETQRSRAEPLEGGRVRLYASTQSPYAVQQTVAKILGLANHQVEVDVKRLGGGFGGKEDQATGWACMSALATWILKKPVEIVLSRIDDMKMTGKRHPYSADFKIGFTSKGKVLAYEVNHYQNAGASADLSPAVLERTLFHSTGAYYIPNVSIFACSCRTNLPPNTAFRGFGGPQGMFVIESALAKIAEFLDISREEIQKKNLLEEGDRFSYGQVTKQCNSLKTWEQAEKDFHLSKRKEEIFIFNQSHISLKKGIGVMPLCFGISFTATFLNQASSLVHVYTDGSVSVTTGGIEMGQGFSTNIASITARTFGIHPSRVRVESTNTTRIANMSPSAASATTDLNGHATILAVKKILDSLKEVMAKKINVKDPENIVIRGEKVYYLETDTGSHWEDIVESAYFERLPLSAHAHYSTPGVWFDKTKEKGRPFAYHVYGTAIVEVTVDCLRGTYNLDSVKIVHDLGRSINPMIDQGQVEGAVAQGLGWMTIEDLQFDNSGKILSSSLATYKAPDLHFMPDDFQIHFLEEENPEGPCGSKAVGEPPLMYGIGVFFAIQNAMKSFSKDVELSFEAPLTPEKVLMGLYQRSMKKL